MCVCVCIPNSIPSRIIVLQRYTQDISIAKVVCSNFKSHVGCREK